MKALALTLLLSTTLAADTFELKIASQAPERSIWGQSFQKMGEDIEEATNGRVRVKTYSNGVQGDEKTVLRKVRVQQLHGAAFIGTGLAQICKDSLALQLPLLFQDAKEVDAVMKEVEPLLAERCAKAGYEVMAWPHLGFSYLLSKNPVGTIKQFRAAKPWLIENDRLTKALFEELRVNPVTVGVTDVLPGLQSGLVDTVFCPPAGMVALQWHTKLAYQLDTPVNYSVGVLALSKRSWKRLPEDLQKIVRKTIVDSIDALNAKVQGQNRDALAAMSKRGIKLVTIDPAARKELVKATESIRKKLRGKEFSPELDAKIHATLKELRASK